jgi:uncharacterized membrane-anchored protein
MKQYQSAGTNLRARRMTHLERRQAARTVMSKLALVALGMMSLFGLGGCEAIKTIFKAGVWSGVVIVVVLVAVVGGIAAMVMKKR